MIHLFKKINKKINSLIWGLISTGVLLMMLAILIVWTDFLLRLVVGLIVLAVAYTFLYSGYKLWMLKKEIEDHMGMK
ncbi:MAG: hypothetical protein U9R06_03440 [Patescibacteria group bacterium]|nr:hypothetical protein [Patescibacteria group bacterium]